MLDCLLQYAERGWAVFPVHSVINGVCTCGKPNCSSPGKHPVHKGWKDLATTDPDQLKSLFGTNQRLNIGIATGTPSGVYVVDVDVKPDRDGLEALRQQEANHSPLDKSLSVRTGSGGWHFYLPTHGRLIPNSVGKVGAGIDIRGDGGFVVAPPSRHISGNMYEWVNFNE